MFRILVLAAFMCQISDTQVSPTIAPPIRQTGWQVVSTAGTRDFWLSEDRNGVRVLTDHWPNGTSMTYVAIDGRILYMQNNPLDIQTLDEWPELPNDRYIIGTSTEYAPDFAWESLGVTDQTNFWFDEVLYGLFDGEFRTWDAHAKAVNASKVTGRGGVGKGCGEDDACGVTTLAACVAGTYFCSSCHAGTQWWCPTYRIISFGKYKGVEYPYPAIWYCCSRAEKLCAASADCVMIETVCAPQYPGCPANETDPSPPTAWQTVWTYTQSTTECNWAN